MIFTDYSQHIPKITASPVYTAIKKNIKLCLLFSQGFKKIQVRTLCIFKNAPASGGLRPPDPLPGVAPGPHWGTSVPQTPDFPQLHLLDPPLSHYPPLGAYGASILTPSAFVSAPRFQRSATSFFTV